MRAIMGADVHTQIGRRRDARLRVQVPALLVLVTGQYKAALCNISQTGAQMQVTEPVRTGMDGVLQWLDFEAFGTLVWVKRGFVGMEFDEPLATAVLVETRDLFDQRDFVSEDEAARKQARDWFLGYS